MRDDVPAPRRRGRVLCSRRCDVSKILSPLSAATARPMAAAAPAASGGGFTLRVPGFSYEPIQFNRAFWNTRRTLRLLWTLLTLGVLVTIIGASLDSQADAPACVARAGRLPLSTLTVSVLHCAVLTVLASQHRVRFAAQPQQLAFIFSTVFTCLTGAWLGRSVYGVVNEETSPWARS